MSCSTGEASVYTYVHTKRTESFTWVSAICGLISNEDRLMSKHDTANEVEDAEQWVKTLSPADARRGRTHLEDRIARAKSMASRKKAISVRIDEDVIEKLKAMAGEDGSYQTLLNRALIEWCEAQEIGGLLEEQLQRLERLASRVESALK